MTKISRAGYGVVLRVGLFLLILQRVCSSRSSCPEPPTTVSMEDSPSTTATEEQLLGHIRRQGILLDELTVKVTFMGSATCFAPKDLTPLSPHYPPIATHLNTVLNPSRRALKLLCEAVVTRGRGRFRAQGSAA